MFEFANWAKIVNHKIEEATTQMRESFKSQLISFLANREQYFQLQKHLSAGFELFQYLRCNMSRIRALLHGSLLSFCTLK